MWHGWKKMKNKIKTRDKIEKICEELKKNGKKIVSTNGSFDIFQLLYLSFQIFFFTQY